MTPFEIAASISAVAGAIAAIFAALAANSSAKTAELSQRYVQDQERDNLISNVLDTATQVMHSAVATSTLLKDTKVEMDALFALSGRAKGGIHIGQTEELERQNSALGAHEDLSREIVENPSQLGELEVNELKAKLAVLRGLLTAVLRLKEKLERDYASYHTQRMAKL
tara:strand:- start:56 stop:559 length:504 start_codon:yes stop_codon:yes gene_type:complete